MPFTVTFALKIDLDHCRTEMGESVADMDQRALAVHIIEETLGIRYGKMFTSCKLLEANGTIFTVEATADTTRKSELVQGIDDLGLKKELVSIV